MTENEQRAAAKKFAEFWKDKGYEKGESQSFWLSLLRDVYGVSHPEEFISFEEQVHLDHTSFIDGFIPSTKVMIEQKGLGKNLNKPIRQSDGALLTPFEQAKRYITELPLSIYAIEEISERIQPLSTEEIMEKLSIGRTQNEAGQGIPFEEAMKK